MSRVALLGREDQVRAQLRAALVDAGAEVALERDLAGLRLEELRACDAATIIVNLDPGSEDALDQLDELMADPEVRVVFNESETTGQLAGWDLARWARHLVAKVVGDGDSTPPPPPGAELLPLRELSIEPGAPRVEIQEAGQQEFERVHAEAAASSEGVPSSPRIEIIESTARSPAPDQDTDTELVQIELEREPAEPDGDELAVGSIEREPMHDEPQIDDAPLEVSVVRPFGEEQLDSFSLDVGEIEGALSGIEAGSRPGLDPAAEQEGAVPRRLGPDEPTVVLSREDLEQALSAAAKAADQQLPSPAAAAEPVEDSIEVDELSIDQFDSEAELNSTLPRRLGPDEPTTVLELGELEAELNDLAEDIEQGEAPLDPIATESLDIGLEMGDDSGLSVDAGAGELNELDQFDFDAGAEVDQTQRPSLSADDYDDGDLSLDEDVAALAAQFDALSAGSENGQLVDDFSTDLDAGLEVSLDSEPAAEAAPPTAVPEPPTARKQAASVGFGELSLLDLDADISTPTAPQKAASSDYDFDSLNLSLEPLAEETEEGSEAEAVAVTDAPRPIKPVAGISRVVVLAASIGGPDAVRTFLSGIPENFPALFLLSQHLESGFFGRLAQQLQKVTPLTVRVAEGGADAVSNGDVIVVPSGKVYSIAQDGRIESFEYSEPPRYKPCIDDLLREVAAQFGPKVTAIVFSGMAGDGVEGAAEVTRKGGEVWAQSPASCVVSSMVDGALARGVVEFVGTPRELAERIVQKYAAG
ncbi:chemotaxis protein CheB [Pseudomarimonas arenosa]|uniref:protein-glutamate methylesterase n=1 Tax=Pseudomarimonas arenosa TaxID=2774145 RepID=A0AAW3ZKW7_9GAMM|nr:chemotaxis protein CheB [Pseudomarimonas arenosa]MBD8525565.1 chemotaxis protein CheB [Pseudomarimonas arenosa]